MPFRQKNKDPNNLYKRIFLLTKARRYPDLEFEVELQTPLWYQPFYGRNLLEVNSRRKFNKKSQISAQTAARKLIRSLSRTTKLVYDACEVDTFKY